MKKFNLYNSKIFRFFDYVFRLVLINLFILLPSFLLFYIMTIFFNDLINTVWGLLTLVPAVLYMFPAICAGVDLIRKYELKETNGVFKEFFKRCSCKRKNTGIEYVMAIFFPYHTQGLHFGIKPTTRLASSSNSGQTPPSVLMSVNVPSVSMVKPTKTRPCILASKAASGYLRFLAKNFMHSAIPPGYSGISTNSTKHPS